MDKRKIIALMIAFIAMKNPVVDLATIQKAYAEPAKVEVANALSEADIAVNIDGLYKDQILTTEEKAKTQIEENNKQIEKEIEQKRIAEEARIAKEIGPKTNALVAAGLSSAYVTDYVKAAKTYNVPWQIIAAVHTVETHQSGDSYVTSYAGAQGPMQFMPSTFRSFAQDGDGDGNAVIGNVHDAIATAASYMASNGAASGDVVSALYRYNHDSGYVYYVLSIARSLGYNK